MLKRFEAWLTKVLSDRQTSEANPTKVSRKRKAKPKVAAKPKDIQEVEGEEIDRFTDFLNAFGNNYEQKRAVITPSKRVVVLAGAGSGKTKVLTNRFIFLIKHKQVLADNILALTFTREAASEMVRRIAEALDLQTDRVRHNVRTFHSFCFSVLKQNEQFDIVTEDMQMEIIEDIIFDSRNDKELMTNLYEYLKEGLYDKIKEKENESSKEPQVKGKPLGFGDRIINTNDGVKVRSKSERDIANLLSSLGLKWEYEQPVTWADKKFNPDFTIEGDIYLEHWCYNDKSIEFLNIDKKTYLKHRALKEEQFSKHNKTLISVEEYEMRDWLTLQARLKGQLMALTQKQFEPQQILEILQTSDIYKMSYKHFLDELLEIINLIKARLMPIEEVEERSKNAVKEKVINFYKVLIPVFKEYNRRLRTQEFGKKDFNDLIADTIKLLKENDSRRAYYQRNIKHLLVDEYQDVSYAQVELLKLLITEDTPLFIVGDDWQAIYGWRGSDVKFILKFDKDFGEYRQIILPINYRSSKNIVDASCCFIQSGNNQVQKNIRCCEERMVDTSKIMQINADNDFSGAKYVIFKITKMMEENKDLTKNDFLILYRSKNSMGGYKFIFKQEGFRVPMHTIHWAKGQEFKYVFVLGMKGGFNGFPSFYPDKDIKKLIVDVPIEDKADEERRVFYVAMTRAKERLFLISEKGNESVFCQEIPMQYKFVYSGQE